MKKNILLIIIAVAITSCVENTEPQARKSPIGKVEEKTHEVKSEYEKFEERLEELIIQSKIEVENNDYLDIVYVDTNFYKDFYSLWEEIIKTPYKNLPASNKCRDIWIGIAQYKYDIKDNKKTAKQKEKGELKKPSEWEVTIGWWKESVVSCWGKPDNIIKSTNQYGTVEMYYYFKRHKVLTIVDDYVESITEYTDL